MGSTRFATVRTACCSVWIALLSGALAAPPVVPADASAAAQRRVDLGYTPGLVIGLVNADGRTTWSYGGRSWSDPTPPDGGTVYEIASVTKTFTAALLAQMVGVGEVALDDPVALYLPAGTAMPANGGEAITLEQLATHHSGLPATTPPPACAVFQPESPLAGYGPEEIEAFLAGHTLARAPGEAFEYSNFGIALLGHALARSRGMGFEALLRERVLDPLGMADTAITLTPALEARRAPGHGGYVERSPFVMDGLAPAGGLVSTLDDMLTYLEHQMGLAGGGALGDALATTHVYRAPNPGIGGVGLAWWLWQSLGVVQHSGDSTGSAAFIGFHPGTGVGAVVLSNARRHENAEVLDLGLRCLGAIPGVLPTTAPASVAAALKQSYTGRYRLGASEVGIGLVRGELTLITNGIEATLYPRGPRRFTYFDAAGNADITFAVDGGEVTGASLMQFGATHLLEKKSGPPELAARRVCDEIELEFRGEPLASYVLEASDDGETWSVVGAASARGPRYREPIAGGPRVFRVVEEPGAE